MAVGYGTAGGGDRERDPEWRAGGGIQVPWPIRKD